MKILKNFLDWHSNYLYYYLFGPIGLLLVLLPFPVHFEFMSYFNYLLVSVVVMNCVLILFNNSSNAGYGLLALAVSLLFIWLTNTNNSQNTTLEMARLFLMMIFFISAIVKMLKEIFWLKHVNARVIVGALGAYLLLGLVGSMLFEMVELIYQDIFNHGDINPLIAQGMTVVILLASTGQLYFTILKAMLLVNS